MPVYMIRAIFFSALVFYFSVFVYVVVTQA